jgi:hypothetical protein
MGKRSSPPSLRDLFIERRRRLFTFIPLVGSNIIRSFLEFLKEPLGLTNRSLDVQLNP